MRSRILAGLLCGLFAANVYADGIVGPDQTEPGNLAVFRAGGVPADDYKWAILPESSGGQFFSFTERDGTGKVVSSTAIFASSKPGKYSVVLARVSGGTLALDTHSLINGGDEPPPEPEPEPGPTPPEPDPDKPSQWAAWIKQEVERTMPAVGRSEDARKIATAIEASIAAANAGVYKSPRGLRIAIKQATNQALGERAAVWERQFDDAVLTPKLRKLLADGKLATIKQHISVYTEIARGLRLVTGTTAIRTSRVFIQQGSDCIDGNCPTPQSYQWRRVQ